MNRPPLFDVDELVRVGREVSRERGSANPDEVVLEDRMRDMRWWVRDDHCRAIRDFERGEWER